MIYLSGSPTVDGRTVDIDVNLIQVLHHLVRVPFIGYGELRKASFAAINYEVMKREYDVSAYLGYRALSVDYVQGSGRNRYDFDVIEHGPVVELTVKY